jgi:hypothetical protein
MSELYCVYLYVQHLCVICSSSSSAIPGMCDLYFLKTFLCLCGQEFLLLYNCACVCVCVCGRHELTCICICVNRKAKLKEINLGFGTIGHKSAELSRLTVIMIIIHTNVWGTYLLKYKYKQQS